jgi:hypothetical protein
MLHGQPHVHLHVAAAASVRAGTDALETDTSIFRGTTWLMEELLQL